ncbi:uncharacterized protein DUF4153 [Algoriphagus boseongensis]|uniref:Uncharacterized protein DUF4153 n=1 Tax=Algoriphagus boseongensis TaxID=1442587 RepID=A0A4R6T6R2_9BACT|nr:DUF4153 domain-containing protein [Algoriphagus boseongensis]TDQ16658.1 uncharacterized protein DUF4153 [Algoriphagus boseongensis]
MKNQIQSNIDKPSELEKLYRKNKSHFKQEFNSIYPEIKGQALADFWNERLNFESESISWGSRKEWQFVIIAALIAGFFAKFPAIFSIDEEFFYPRNMAFVAFPFVSAYFLWKNKTDAQVWGKIAGIIAISLVYINLLPDNSESDTLVLACIHLPLLLWAVLGFSFVEGKMGYLPGRLDYLRFNGDAVVMGAILLLSGLLMSGITIGLFGLIGIKIEKFYMEWIAVFGLASAPLVATHLTQTNPQLVNKVSPIVAKIFSPLVLIMLVIYLGAIIYSGKDPYNDREFLLLFNMLLIGVMGLIFFSVAESAEEGKNKMGNWVLMSLSIITVIVNGIALSAIAFRISEWGITPNRMAVLGVNILMLIHLLMVSKNLIRTVQGKSKLEEVGLTIVRYLPIYFLWTALVVFGFPWLFGFK